MKKLLFSMIALFAIVLMSCGGAAKPTGSPEKDADNFAKAVVDAVNSDNVEALSNAIDEYYLFYKNEPRENAKIFFAAFKDCMEKYEGKIDQEKFEEMVSKADPYDKMDSLYRMSKYGHE